MGIIAIIRCNVNNFVDLSLGYNLKLTLDFLNL